MKKSFALASLVLALGATLSCEQQTWEQTKMFKQTRHAEHGADHGGEHAPAAGHAAQPAGPHAPAAAPAPAVHQ